MVERIWVEVNTRVNYPVKAALLHMFERGDINLEDSAHKFCVSWFSIKVVSVGIDLFINSWNNHPIPGTLIHCSIIIVPDEIDQEYMLLVLLCRQETWRNGHSHP